MTAVARVDRQPGYLGGAQERSAIRRVGVLTRLQPPLQARRRPDLFPEGNDTRQRVVARRIEESKGESRRGRDVVQRRLGGCRSGPERVGARPGRPPVRASLELDRHRSVRRYLRHLGQDQLLSAHRGQRQVQAREPGERARERSGRDDHRRRLHRPGRRGHAANAIALPRKPRDDPARFETGSARPSQLQGQPSRLEPAVALAEARIHDVARQVREALPRRRTVQQLDIIESPTALRRDQVFLSAGPLLGPRGEEVSLMAKSDVDALMQVVEECHALAHQLDLLDVVELQAKRARGDRRGEGRQCWAFLENDGPKSGALGEKRGRAADDAAADDDEIGGLGR